MASVSRLNFLPFDYCTLWLFIVFVAKLTAHSLL